MGGTAQQSRPRSVPAPTAATAVAEKPKALVNARDRLKAEPPARRGLKLRIRLDCRASRHRLWSTGLGPRRVESPGSRRPVEVTYLPANLHNRPERIVPSSSRCSRGGPQGRGVFVRADCGTGGALDALLARHPRQPGCGVALSSSVAPAVAAIEKAGHLFLTDFLAKHFEALLWQGSASIATHSCATCTSATTGESC